MFSAPENVNLSVVHSEEMLHSKFQALFVYHIFKQSDQTASKDNLTLEVSGWL